MVCGVSVLRSIRARVLAIVLGAFTLVMVVGLTAVILVSLGTVRTQAGSTATATVNWLAEETAHRSPDQILADHANDVAPERIIQFLDEHGRVIAQAPAGLAPITSRRGVLHRPSVELVSQIADFDGDGFAIAVVGATDATGTPLTVAVATPSTIEEGTEALLLLLILLTGAVLLTLVGVGVRYAVTAALKPVEQLRLEARDITDLGSAASLPVPPGDDELTRLATTLNELLTRLRTSDRARRAFVSDAGHELRSPLATARVAVDRLADPSLSKPERRDAVERVRLALTRLGSVVSDLLALSRLDEASGGTAPVIDLDDIVLRAVRGHEGRFVPTVALEPARIAGDPMLWDRLVRNLIDNADRHAVTAVRVRVHAAGERVTLAVDNDGPPVAEADRDRVFERFVRLDEGRARDAGGSGLGLSIVAAVAERSGGHATTGAAPDGWCRFEVEVGLA